MTFFLRETSRLLPGKTLPGRDTPMIVTNRHYVNKHPVLPPFPAHLHRALFGLGCFWGAEYKFWQLPGVFSTAVGYCGGEIPNPTYNEVCSGQTGHAEVINVIYDPVAVSYEQLLKLFWISHNPTQGMRQGNDIGTQYRSYIGFYSPEQEQTALASKQHYQHKLTLAGQGIITTEIIAADIFYYAEDYHQQYLAKHPEGYCGLGGLAIAYD